MTNMNNKRCIAIQLMNSAMKDNAISLVKQLNEYSLTKDIILFYAESANVQQQDIDGINVKAISIPSDKDNSSKAKNFILEHCQSSYKDMFVHLIEDNVQLFNDPCTYVEKIEHVMDVLDYSIHFSTVTDPCNYVFKKYNPRISLVLDDEDVKNKLDLPMQLSFTSHSNTTWTIYDLHKMPDPQKYDEKFSIGMFMIIEYLARRRNTKKPEQLYFMNQYLAIEDEIGVFGTLDYNDNNINSKAMTEEDAIFKSMNINYLPDNNIDVVLEQTYKMIQSKIDQMSK